MSAEGGESTLKMAVEKWCTQCLFPRHLRLFYYNRKSPKGEKEMGLWLQPVVLVLGGGGGMGDRSVRVQGHPAALSKSEASLGDSSKMKKE